jgi:uncharacterized protein (TIGR03086 family)
VTTGQTTIVLATHERAAAILRDQLHEVDGRHLDLPVTSCPGWTVSDLLDHVVGGAKRYALLLEGAPSALVEETRHQRQPFPTIAVDYVRLEERFRRAYREASPGVTVNHRAGAIGRDELLRMRLLECVLHRWDLGHAIGSGPALDDSLCATVLSECASTLTRLAQLGFYAPLPERAGEGNAARLLAASGRRADPSGR